MLGEHGQWPDEKSRKEFEKKMTEFATEERQRLEKEKKENAEREKTRMEFEALLNSPITPVKGNKGVFAKIGLGLDGLLAKFMSPIMRKIYYGSCIILSLVFLVKAGQVYGVFEDIVLAPINGILWTSAYFGIFYLLKLIGKILKIFKPKEEYDEIVILRKKKR